MPTYQTLETIPPDLETGEQDMLHPVTKKWMRMTIRQWTLAKLGMDNAKVDDWTLLVLQGPEAIIEEGFGISRYKNLGAFKWLMFRYEAWFKVGDRLSKPTGVVARDWIRFIKEVYNLERILRYQDALFKTNIDLLKTKIESEKLKDESQRIAKKRAIQNFKRTGR